MKCAILLALCAFETVFADEQFREKLENLRDEKKMQMQNIVDSLGRQVEEAIEDAVKNGLTHEILRTCWDDHYKLIHYYESRFSHCAHCFWKALQDTDFKFAEECFAENVELLEGKEQECRLHSRECIAKYYVKHLGAGEPHPAILL